MTEPSKIPAIFCEGGDRSQIPVNSERLGFASYEAGFPPETQVPLDAGGVAPRRQDFNGLFFVLSEALRYIEEGGQWSYSSTVDYEPLALVKFNNVLYQCRQGNGPSSSVVTPTASTAYWCPLLNLDGVFLGNASTATKLQTVRSINGTNFDGTANITTARWGNSRGFTVSDHNSSHTGANTNVDGGGAVNLKLPSTITASLNGNATTANTATSANYATSAGNATLWGGYTQDFNTNNGSDTWLLVMNGSKVQHRTVDSLRATISTPYTMRPNYSYRVSLSNGVNYTAPQNGFVIVSLRNSGGSLSINGVTYVSSTTVDWNSKTERLMFTFPVAQGDVVRCNSLLAGWFIGSK